MLLALLPLALAALYYVGRGLFEDWLFANILSIFEKAPDAPAAIAGRVADTVREFGRPFAIAAMLAAAQCIFRKDPVLKASSLFLAGWLLSGIAAFALLSAAYHHYALVSRKGTRLNSSH